MGVKKCDMIFNLGEASWTETHYLPESNDMVVALATLVSLTAARSYLTAKQTLISEVRVSDVTILGDSTIQTNGLGGFGNADLPSSGPETAVLERATMGTRHRGQMWIRGMPRAWIVWSDEFDQETWTTDYGKWSDAYHDRLVNQGFGAIVKLKPGEDITGGGNVQVYPVTKLEPFPTDDINASSTQVTSTLPIGDLTAGREVVITGARKTAKAINGTYPLVVTPVGGVFVVPQSYVELQGWQPADLAKCKIYVVVRQFAAYTSFTRRFVRGKKYGTDHALPRGRVRTR